MDGEEKKGLFTRKWRLVPAVIEQNPTYKKIFVGVILVMLVGIWSQGLSGGVTPKTTESGNASVPTKSNKIVIIGDEGVAYAADGGEVPIIATKEGYEAISRAASVNDQYGVLEMMSSGQYYPVKSGTKVLVIDATISLRKVRILEGIHEGRSGWTSSTFVAAQ